MSSALLENGLTETERRKMIEGVKAELFRLHPELETKPELKEICKPDETGERYIVGLSYNPEESNVVSHSMTILCDQKGNIVLDKDEEGNKVIKIVKTIEPKFIRVW